MAAVPEPRIRRLAPSIFVADLGASPSWQEDGRRLFARLRRVDFAPLPPDKPLALIVCLRDSVLQVVTAEARPGLDQEVLAALRDPMPPGQGGIVFEIAPDDV